MGFVIYSRQFFGPNFLVSRQVVAFWRIGESNTEIKLHHSVSMSLHQSNFYLYILWH